MRHLVGEYALAVSVTALDLGGINAVLVSGVDDPVRLGDALAKLAVIANFALQGAFLGGAPAVETKQVNGGLVQSLDVPVPDLGAIAHVEFGIVQGRFILGYRNGLRDFLAGTTEPLAANPRYQAAMALLPAERDWQLYVDLSQLGPLAQPLLAISADPLGPLAVVAPSLDLSALQALAAAGYTRDGLRGMSLVLSVAPDPEPEPVATPAPAPGAGAPIRVVQRNFAFEPAEVTHNFSVDALGVDVAPGASRTVGRNAPAGEDEFSCNVPDHREAGMLRRLFVE